MELGLTDKVYIVTGGAKGIGAGIVRAIAEEGGIPVIIGRTPDVGAALAEELKAKGHKAFVVTKELGTPESCRDSISETLELTGRIDGLINNAGANDGVGLEYGTPEAWMDSLARNLHHYYYLAHYALPELKKNRGTIVNISSKTAVTGQGGTSAYAAAKGAQLALTREWAVELLPYGIRVNAILPAEVMTPLYEKWLKTFQNSEEKLADITRNIPLGNRMTTADEIASMAVYLLSDKAGHITGQHLFVDGGYVHLDRALLGLE
ncbi:MAG: SDR family oxidoreductase [Saprospiraceae bacterium]|nr:SDR family oxidoreductase [Saprospiraceae bacterium]MCB9324672.1 SDR family oxidoreductase [Lewinellaceae bacterium]